MSCALLFTHSLSLPVSFAAFVVLLYSLSFSLSLTLLFLDLHSFFLPVFLLSFSHFLLLVPYSLPLHLSYSPSSNLISFSFFLLFFSSFSRTIILTGIHACCTKGNLRTAVIDLLAAPVSAVMRSLILRLL